jgi:hypothetical protein
LFVADEASNNRDVARDVELAHFFDLLRGFSGASLHKQLVLNDTASLVEVLTTAISSVTGGSLFAVILYSAKTRWRFLFSV